MKMEPTKEKTVTVVKPLLGLTPGMRIMGDECFRYTRPDVKVYDEKFSKDIDGLGGYTFVHFDSLKAFYDFVISTSLTYGPECFKEVHNGKPYQRVYIDGCTSETAVSRRIVRLKLEQTETTGEKTLFELFVHIGDYISDLFKLVSHYSIQLTDKHTLKFIDSKGHVQGQRLQKFSYKQFQLEDPLFGNDSARTLLDAIWLHSLGNIAKDTLSAVIVKNISTIISDQDIVKKLKVKGPFIIPCSKARKPLAAILSEEKAKELKKKPLEKPSPSPKKAAAVPVKATPLPKKVSPPKEDDLEEAVSSKQTAASVGPFPSSSSVRKPYPALPVKPATK